MNDEALLLKLYRGNRAAVDLAKSIALVADVWDNLYDGDKPVAKEKINQAFWLALFDIPTNPLYEQAQGLIRSVMISGYFSWCAANMLEKRTSDHHAMTIAHVARYGLADALVMIAFVVGGREWAETVAPEIRLMCQRDKLADYLKEKGHAEST